jgi:hypothetical protein
MLKVNLGCGRVFVDLPEWVNLVDVGDVLDNFCFKYKLSF